MEKAPSPTLAPAEQAKQAAPKLPSIEPKKEQPAPKPEAKPVDQKQGLLPLPTEAAIPSKSVNSPKAAGGNNLPSETPSEPKHPKTKSVEEPSIAPSEKPLVAVDDNPFILETDQLQIWTDASGDYRLEARFISFQDETVRLQRPNGQYVRIAMDRLSLADRERVHDLSLALAMKTSMN